MDTTRIIYNPPLLPHYILQTLQRSYDSHDETYSDVWVWSDRDEDCALKRLKMREKKFHRKGVDTRVVKVTKEIISFGYFEE
jgi:hypothetical protein